MDNLHFYEREMEKINQSASKNLDYWSFLLFILLLLEL